MWYFSRFPPPPAAGNLFSLVSSMPNMTGRPGCRTMEMNGGRSAPYLACTPCAPLFCTLFNRGGREGLLDYQGRAGIISIVQWNIRLVIFGVDKHPPRRLKEVGVCEIWGAAFLLTVEAFLLRVKLLCLQSLKALIRRTFPL